MPSGHNACILDVRTYVVGHGIHEIMSGIGYKGSQPMLIINDIYVRVFIIVRACIHTDPFQRLSSTIHVLFH